ncbi:MAG: polysaccharide biosynthesis C-terminal domain-containing protein [Sulfurovaceae bacterium]|nr:polysaccharide biosynthesis C-terminal domain-containing protein [Sulfurovaceae bacterium]
MFELIQISIINIFAKLLKFLFEIGTNYFVDKETYGYFAILLSYVLIYSRIVTFGISNIMLRDFPKKSNINYHSFLLFNSTIIMLIITIISALIISFFKIEYLSSYIEIPIVALSTGLLVLYSSYIRSLGYIKLWVFFQDIIWYIYYFIGLFTIYFFSNRPIDISMILGIYSYSILLALFSLIVFIKYRYYLLFISKFSIKKIRYIYTHSFPVLFTGLTYLILARIDVIMLGNHVSMELVGEYNIVARVTIQVLFFHQVIVAFFYPRLAKKFAMRDDYKKIARYNSKFVLLSFLSVLSTSIFLYILIIDFNLFDILHISHQDELFWVFIIFTLTQIIYSAISFYGYVLIYLHKQKIEYINNIIILTFGILLNFILIPYYGVIGASLASAIAILLGNFLEMFQVKHYTNTFFITSPINKAIKR